MQVNIHQTAQHSPCCISLVATFHLVNFSTNAEEFVNPPDIPAYEQYWLLYFDCVAVDISTNPRMKHIFSTFVFDLEKMSFIVDIFLYQSEIFPETQKSYLENRANILKLFKIKNPTVLRTPTQNT